MKRLSRYIYDLISKRMSEPYKEGDFKRSAIVFSPHFDDEVLGCGGIIIKKKRAGADIKIVFMTDGSKSHRHMMAEQELSKIRTQEACAAAVSMGLTSEDVICLNFEETKLNQHEQSAIENVSQLLSELKPEEIFVPFFGEPYLWSHDHVLTNKIIHTAIRKSGCSAVIYEYPIWFWSYWPWATLPIKGLVEFLRLVKHSAIAGTRYLRHLTCRAYIGDVLQQKKGALEQYRSQMTRLLPDSRWKTLSDVANGEFLRCFFQENEVFFKQNGKV